MICDSARRLDLLGRGDTAAHRLDPRVKLLAALAFLLTLTSFGKYEVLPLLLLSAFPLYLLHIGKVPGRLLLEILCLTSPFVLMVGIFNPFLDTKAIQLLDVEIPAGILSLLSILIRFALSVSMLVALVGTTSMQGLIGALSLLKVPSPIVNQTHFLYRYIFLLVEEARDVSRARALRDTQKRLPSFKTATRMLSALSRRSLERSERIFRSMKTRGFDGEMPRIDKLRMTPGDYLFLTACVAFCAAIRFL